MADARLHLTLNQPREASEVLEQVTKDVCVPPELKQQWEALVRQVDGCLAAEDHQSSFLSSGSGQVANEPQTAPNVESFSATFRFRPAPDTIFFPHDGAVGEPSAFRDAVPTSLYPQAGTTQVPDDLREFLPPERPSIWKRGVFWLSIGAIALAASLYWFSVDHKRTEATPKAPIASGEAPARAESSSYVELNAGPWGTVKEVRSLGGQTVRHLNDQTPVRLNVPPGRYQVTIEGPRGQSKVVEVEVPEQGGHTYIVVFHKPDIERIISSK
jgi:hypothetical protein